MPRHRFALAPFATRLAVMYGAAEPLRALTTLGLLVEQLSPACWTEFDF